jgi:hypothetical protein
MGAFTQVASRLWLIWKLADFLADITVWAVDFETPVGSSTFFSFFRGQHRQQ